MIEPQTHRARGAAVWPIGAFLIVAMVTTTLVATTGGAQANEHTFNRGLAGACTQEAQLLDRFPDVPREATHAQAISCLSHWEIVFGRDDGQDATLYAPGEDVSRAAMASFVARTLQRLPAVELPMPADDPFADYDVGAHVDNVALLRAAGIVEGRVDGTYGPAQPVTRGAMASYIARLLEFVTEEEIPVDDDLDPAFPDTQGVHETNIDKLATLGIVTGREDGSYGLAQPVTRGAMASFIARSMDYLAFRGYLPVPFDIDVVPAASEAPANLNQRITGVVRDQFATGYFSAEIRFEVYRDDALVLTSNLTSGLGGDIEFRYNAAADQGDTDRVVACVVSPADRTEIDVPYCLDVDDLEPIEDRRVTELTVRWGDLAVASTAPDEGEFFGMALDINPDDDVLGYQSLPTPDAPSDVPLGEFYVFEYDDAANFQVGGETNVATEVFECAVELSIADERNPHLLNISRDTEDWNTYSLTTSTDVRWCF